MIYTIVAGENATQLCHGLGAVLGKFCGVAMAQGSSLWASGSRADVLLWQGQGDLTVQAPGSILVFGQPSRRAVKIEVPADCVVVADWEDEAAASFAARRGLCLLDCGLSTKASLTFSSIGREVGVVALQRSITDQSGRRVDPLELPLALPGGARYPLLAAVGILLLGGMGARLEGQLAAKNGENR